MAGGGGEKKRKDEKASEKRAYHRARVEASVECSPVRWAAALLTACCGVGWHHQTALLSARSAPSPALLVCSTSVPSAVRCSRGPLLHMLQPVDHFIQGSNCASALSGVEAAARVARRAALASTSSPGNPPNNWSRLSCNFRPSRLVGVRRCQGFAARKSRRRGQSTFVALPAWVRLPPHNLHCRNLARANPHSAAYPFFLLGRTKLSPCANYLADFGSGSSLTPSTAATSLRRSAATVFGGGGHIIEKANYVLEVIAALHVSIL
ncbi:hypothetical protein FH972_022127 [Carpinus fangiana]|uniref:Uncharacterized protein n=1 Tax=Carpinus fangiana TaxID=176857 RepID=A0A5N6KRV6_9ROSI|nr:hypothetical protein FH972_022127 [Carpinus fangiana]